MKISMKYILTIIFVLGLVQLEAQTDKNFILILDQGYYYQHKDNIDASNALYGSNQFGEKINDLTFNFYAGKKFKSHFYYGLGLSYCNFTDELNPNADVPAISESIGYGNILGYSNKKEIQNEISPLIFFQYFTNISNRITIAVEFYSKYSFNKTETNHLHYEVDSASYSYVIYEEIHENTEKEYFCFGLQPVFKLDIYKNFGMELRLKLVEYTQKTYDSVIDREKKTSNFEIGFKPENWLIGFYIRL